MVVLIYEEYIMKRCDMAVLGVFNIDGRTDVKTHGRTDR